MILHRLGQRFCMQEVTPKVVAMAVITAATTCSTVRQTVSLFMA